MPITRKEFELGVDIAIAEWMRKIHDYLVLHREEAFTDQELGRALGLEVRENLPGLWPREKAEVFENALGKLIEVKAVGSRLIRGVTYYSLGAAPLPI